MAHGTVSAQPLNLNLNHEPLQPQQEASRINPSSQNVTANKPAAEALVKLLFLEALCISKLL